MCFGFTCVNDVTARDFQKEDGTYARAKGLNTSAPLAHGSKRRNNGTTEM